MGFCKGSGEKGQDLYQPKFHWGKAFAQSILSLYMVIESLNLQQMLHNKCFSSSIPTFDQFWNVLLKFADVILKLRYEFSQSLFYDIKYEQNRLSSPAYGVYASQLIRYARCCSNYSDFLSCHRALVTRLLSQGYKVNCLSNTFKKFYGRHTDLVGQYKKSICQMFADSIS